MNNPSTNTEDSQKQFYVKNLRWIIPTILGTWGLAGLNVYIAKANKTVEHTTKSVEWLITEGGDLKLDIIVDSAGKLECISGNQSFPTTTKKIGIHPSNSRTYDATEAFMRLKTGDKVSVSFSKNGDYLIVDQNGVEIFKSFVSKEKRQVNQPLQDLDTRATRLASCNMMK